MTYTKFLILMMLLPIVSFAQRSKNQTASLNPDFTPKLTTYEVQLMNLNYTSMMYWYQTTKDLDSLYQLEKLKTHYYSKITGIQANSYETLQEIYDNKQSIEKAIAQEKELQIKDLKKRNRRLVAHNVVLSLGISALAVSTLYFVIL